MNFELKPSCVHDICDPPAPHILTRNAGRGHGQLTRPVLELSVVLADDLVCGWVSYQFHILTTINLDFLVPAAGAKVYFSCILNSPTMNIQEVNVP